MTQFTDMDLGPEIQKALTEIGFDEPTPIQKKIIPVILEGNQDVVGLAQTGTGKTAAFGLPVIQRIDHENMDTQVLIMAPTRELTLQISADLKLYSKHLKKLKIVAAYGGARVDMQIRELKKGAQIIVATPGRLLDLMRRKKINISSIRYLVLDEADEMLNFGFKEEIDAILDQAPANKTTLLFSATMSKGVEKISANYMNKPIEVSVGKKNTGAENIDYHFYVVKAKNRFAAMKRIIDSTPDIYAIVFCRTRQETKDIAEHLIQDGIDADAIHGDLSQPQRDQVMKRFKSKGLRILVATDVASRGIDVKDISHVINYNLPDEVEIYTHRSGRTGRAGKKGVAIAIIHAKENRRLQRIQKMIGQEFIQQKVPGLKDIYKKRLDHYTDKLKNTKTEGLVPREALESATLELSDISKEQLIERLLEIQLEPISGKSKETDDMNIPFHGFTDQPTRSKKKTENERGKYSRKKTITRSSIKDTTPGAPSIRKKSSTGQEPQKEKKSKFDPHKTSPGKSRLFINSGTKFGLTAQNLNEFIKTETQSQVSSVGSIEIMKKFTFFEVSKENEKTVLSNLKKANLHGRDVSVQVAIPPKQ